MLRARRRACTGSRSAEAHFARFAGSKRLQVIVGALISLISLISPAPIESNNRLLYGKLAAYPLKVIIILRCIEDIYTTV